MKANPYQPMEETKDKNNYIFSVSTEDGKKIEWLYPSPGILKPDTLDLMAKAAVNIIRGRRPDLKDAPLNLKIRLNEVPIDRTGKEITPPNENV